MLPTNCIGENIQCGGLPAGFPAGLPAGFPAGLPAGLPVGLSDCLPYVLTCNNDGFNGSKKTKSETYQYRQKTVIEIEEELLSEQKSTINNLEKNISENQNQQKEFEKIQQEIQSGNQLLLFYV